MTYNQQLIEAAEQGHLDEVLRLIPFADPREDNSEALAQAARHGFVECVEALIPVSDPCVDNSFALWIAANQGHSGCVAVLIPHSRVKDGNCRALRTAARFGHLDCVEILQTQHSQKERVEALDDCILGDHLECLQALCRGVDLQLLKRPFYHCVALNKLELADALYQIMGHQLSNDDLREGMRHHPEYFLKLESQKQSKTFIQELQKPNNGLSERSRKM